MALVGLVENSLSNFFSHSFQYQGCIRVTSVFRFASLYQSHQFWLFGHFHRYLVQFAKFPWFRKVHRNFHRHRFRIEQSNLLYKLRGRYQIPLPIQKLNPHQGFLASPLDRLPDPYLTASHHLGIDLVILVKSPLTAVLRSLGPQSSSYQELNRFDDHKLNQPWSSSFLERIALWLYFRLIASN